MHIHPILARGSSPYFFFASWLVLVQSSPVLASENFHWRCLYTHCSEKHSTPITAAHEELQVQNWDMSNVSWTGCKLLTDTKAECYFKRPNISGSIVVYRFGAGCGEGYHYDAGSGICESLEASQERRQRGLPPQLACVGNPINIVTGNKFQAEADYRTALGPLEFIRYYNSSDSLWRHSFSTKLIIGGSSVSLIESDGRAVLFSKVGSTYVPEPGEFGSLAQKGSLWSYRSRDGAERHFDQEGKLTGILLPSGELQTVVHSPTGVTVKSGAGQVLHLTQDAMAQPLSLTVGNLTIAFKYDAKGRLSEAIKMTSGHTDRRGYHYESMAFSRKLTGITDERGVRYATWAYDDEGRAISSEHTDGTDRVTVSYNRDGTVSVTNVLGKITKYSFQITQGTRQIVAVTGEPSPNCPSSDATFTYDERGLLKTKTDNKGNVTTYEYNERGLEVSRTEAFGTPEARTITTAWHPVLFLPVTVTKPNRITNYTYDAQGRQLSQTLMEN